MNGTAIALRINVELRRSTPIQDMVHTMRAVESAVTEPSSKQTQSSLTRKFAAACIVAAGFFLVAILGSTTFTDQVASRRDFIQYWAAAQQLVHHGNPYDAEAILRLEQGAGMPGSIPHFSISPPVGLALTAPLAHLRPGRAFLLWTMLELGCLALSAWMLWRLFDRRDNRLHLLVFAFAPALSCEYYGQLGIFLLLSLTLFLVWHRVYPTLAGAALLPFILKPHLVLPLAAVLVLWSARERTWRILAGFAVALIACSALSFHYDPGAWAQYRISMSANSDLVHGFLPTLSALLQSVIAPSARWVAFIPEAAACAWAAWYYLTHRTCWNWVEHGLLVLLVALVCAPYAWFMDESILFPAILLGMYAAQKNRRLLLPIFVAGTLAAIEVLANVPTNRWYFLWTPAAWLAWYLYATRRPTNDRVSSDPAL
jgi:hypothetical protein